MKKILLVDDEESIRRILSEVLHDESYDVVSVSSGRTGIEVLEKGGVDLVVVDKQMPDMDGETFIDRVQERCYPVKIIMLTGSIDGCARSKVHGFLKKPVDLDLFLRTISETLKG